MTRFALLANPENRRATFFLEACASLRLPAPRVIAWRDWLAGDVDLQSALADCYHLRIESPGENFEVERLLLARGASASAQEDAYHWTTAENAIALTEEAGRIRFGRQWYHGWSDALSEIAKTAERPTMNAAGDIACLFDKQAAQDRIEAAGVPVPARLGIPNDFDDLRSLADRAGVSRLFLKPTHGSSASGVVALQFGGGGRILATTSVDLDGDNLYNSLRMRTYRDPDEIRRVIDGVCRERALAERWFPKAGISGKAFDLRVLVIAGEARHTVVRTSTSPITNLHLGNERGHPTKVRNHFGDEVWDLAMRTCERAAASFPGCHYVAIDLMIGSRGNSVAVAEANAFGDLIPRVLWSGDDTYLSELRDYPGIGATC